MAVEVYRVHVFVNEQWATSFFLRDGLGSDMEFGTAGSAGTAARAIDMAELRKVDAAEAEAELAAGAILRNFGEVVTARRVEDVGFVAELVETLRTGTVRPDAEKLYVAVDEMGDVLPPLSGDYSKAVEGLAERRPSGFVP